MYECGRREDISASSYMFQHSIGKKIVVAKKTVYFVGSVWN